MNSLWSQIRVYLVAGTAGALGAGGLAQITPNTFRPEPWTESQDRKAMASAEGRILERVRQEAVVDHVLLLKDIPPQSVKDDLRAIKSRLQTIENELRVLDPAFRPKAH